MNNSNYSIESPRRANVKQVPVRRKNLTTVRVRGRDNSYVYGNQDLNETFNNQNMMSQTMMSGRGDEMFDNRKRQITLNRIAKYKEDKLALQIQ